ncbi:hypothetical protein NDU88_012035 [Pleurodeles waltl]|uniref:Uncharacterized protein n=1 Tax=Pleurodeles waltl TaxID=8319 RepID=A0AAV7R340_PLEWA|nr:hypothetical protein NDU88_012035 [Pleurodeles waltl]
MQCAWPTGHGASSGSVTASDRGGSETRFAVPHWARLRVSSGHSEGSGVFSSVASTKHSSQCCRQMKLKSLISLRLPTGGKLYFKPLEKLHKQDT